MDDDHHLMRMVTWPSLLRWEVKKRKVRQEEGEREREREREKGEKRESSLFFAACRGKHQKISSKPAPFENDEEIILIAHRAPHPTAPHPSTHTKEKIGINHNIVSIALVSMRLWLEEARDEGSRSLSFLQQLKEREERTRAVISGES